MVGRRKAKVKKKMRECPIHGWTLFRCKRKYWHTKKNEFSSDYKEKCFKCINEGRYTKPVVVPVKRQKFVSLRE